MKQSKSNHDPSSKFEFGMARFRFLPKRGTYQMKVFPMYVDHVETVRLALEKARKELGTQYDAVALEAICASYLSGAKVYSKTGDAD